MGNSMHLLSPIIAVGYLPRLAKPHTNFRKFLFSFVYFLRNHVIWNNCLRCFELAAPIVSAYATDQFPAPNTEHFAKRGEAFKVYVYPSAMAVCGTTSVPPDHY
jgi:hypothetical protein